MRSLTLLVTLPLLACGGDDGGGHMVTVPDASMQQVDAPMQASCAAMADYGSPTAMQEGALRLCATQTAFVKCPATATQGTTGTTADPLMIVYFAQLNAQNDIFNIELWKTAQNTPIGPAANVDLSTQNQYSSCAACVYVSAQVDDQGNDMGMYLAMSGTANVPTVTLNADATMTRMAGSVSNVNMVHVDLAQDATSTPSADGCTSTLAGLSFDSPTADLMAAFTADKSALEQNIIRRINAKYPRH